MRDLQGTLVRMKSRLTSNKIKEKAYFNCYNVIHNFRTDVVGLNQIATLFKVEYEEHVKRRNYDRIAQYYENVDYSDEDN